MSLVEEVGMKTERRQQLLSEGLSRGPGKRLRVHLVSLIYASINPLAHCFTLSKNIVGITWCRKQDVREPFVSQFSDTTIYYF